MASFLAPKLPAELLAETLLPTAPGGQQFVSVGDVVASDADEGVLRCVRAAAAAASGAPRVRPSAAASPSPAAPASCRGHGTRVLGADLVATTPGVVEHVNKLVAVRALRARYAAEVGDVVVGRVTEVGARETEAQAEAAGMRVWEGRAGSRDSSPQRR